MCSIGVQEVSKQRTTFVKKSIPITCCEICILEPLISKPCGEKLMAWNSKPKSTQRPEGERATERSPEQGRRKASEWSSEGDNFWICSLIAAVLNKLSAQISTTEPNNYHWWAPAMCHLPCQVFDTHYLLLVPGQSNYFYSYFTGKKTGAQRGQFAHGYKSQKWQNLNFGPGLMDYKTSGILHSTKINLLFLDL